MEARRIYFCAGADYHPPPIFDRIVTADIKDLSDFPNDFRMAFHAASSLHHLREWVFEAVVERLYSVTPPLSDTTAW